MEPAFENRSFDTHHMLAEFARKYSLGPRIPTVIISGLLYLFSLIPAVVSGSFREDGFFFVTIGIVLVVMFFLPHYYAWSILRGAKMNNDGILPETVITFGDTIELREGPVSVTVEYRKIVKVVRLKHSYVLMTSRRSGVLLRPECFTKGSFAQFKAFIREKCPNVMIPE